VRKAKLKPGRHLYTNGHQDVANADRLCQLILEVQMAAEGDLCGEQREYHLPRLRELKSIVMLMYPINFINAVGAAS
jgi:hypothetical protein